MNKINKTKAAVFFLILILIVGGFYFASKKGFFAKKNSVPANTISEIKAQATAEISSAQSADSLQSGQQAGVEESSQEQSPTNAVDNKNSQPASSDSNQKNDANTKAVSLNSGVGKIVNKLVSFGFQKASGRTIKAIIIHTSYNALGGDVFDFSKVMQEWKDAGVSPHYAIDRSGTIYQLVADQNIAWHAGNSKLPDGTTDVNGVSIGIEMINDQNSKFTDDQYKALNSLIATLKSKYAIKYVLGHDDIAPGRKTDPWGIEWGKVTR